MMGHGLGTVHYYVDRDPHRQDLLREAEKWALARPAAVRHDPAASVAQACGRLAGVLRAFVMRLAQRFRSIGGHTRPGAWA